MAEDPDRVDDLHRGGDPSADELWAPTVGADDLAPGGQVGEIDHLDPVWEAANTPTPLQGVPAVEEGTEEPAEAHILIDPEHRSVDYHHPESDIAGDHDPATHLDAPYPSSELPAPEPVEVGPPAPPDRYYPPGYKPPPSPWRALIIPVTIAVVGIIIALALLL